MQFTAEVTNEIEGALIGEEIGRGAFRIVFECPFDDSIVIKSAFDERGVQSNIIENKIWREIEYAEHLAKWFAPVVAISGNGRFLVMKKARMSTDRKEFPAKVPHFFTDTKYQNYGFIGDQLVCIDYGSTIISQGMTKRQTKADWWGDEQF